MTQLAVETRLLTKRYGTRVVVDSLDLRLPQGSITGFIGPNGAGKSTTLRMLLGLVRPTSGEGEVLGQPLAQPAGFLPRVGALIESPAFYPGLSGTSNLRVLAALSGVPDAAVNAVIERVGLTGRGEDAYRGYSLGMKQRLGIAAALLGAPDLLILDEPTNGLDPEGMRDVRALLLSLVSDGLTVLVSSHLLAELQQVCDHLLMVEGGRQVFQGPTSALLEGTRELHLAPEHPDDLPVLVDLLRARGLLADRSDGRVRLRPAPGHPGLPEAADLNRAAAAAGITLRELHLTGASLEERYSSLLASAGSR